MDQQKKEPIMMSGPKFGESSGWWSKFKKWANQNGQRITIVIIGLLIIAGGIYLYSTSKQAGAPITEEQAIEDQNQTTLPANQSPSPTPAPSNAPAPRTDLAQLVTTDNNNVIVKANKGAGLTHMSREALKNYLNTHQDLAKNLTAEHKIYIEDYMAKKNTGTRVTVGKEITFNEGLIKDAIDHANKLSQKQLNNLHKYAVLVPSLSS